MINPSNAEEIVEIENLHYNSWDWNCLQDLKIVICILRAP